MHKQLQTHLIGGFSDSDRGADVRCSTTINYTVVRDEVSNCANRVMKCSFRFVDDLWNDDESIL